MATRELAENRDAGECATLYADFGDVHNVTFKEWWMKDDRGARLFAEPDLPNSVMSISPNDVEALLEPWKSGALMVIAIPFTSGESVLFRRELINC